MKLSKRLCDGNELPLGFRTNILLSRFFPVAGDALMTWSTDRH
jgi:hypothetical protein